MKNYNDLDISKILANVAEKQADILNAPNPIERERNYKDVAWDRSKQLTHIAYTGLLIGLKASRSIALLSIKLAFNMVSYGYKKMIEYGPDLIDKTGQFVSSATKALFKLSIGVGVIVGGLYFGDELINSAPNNNDNRQPPRIVPNTPEPIQRRLTYIVTAEGLNIRTQPRMGNNARHAVFRGACLTPTRSQPHADRGWMRVQYEITGGRQFTGYVYQRSDGTTIRSVYRNTPCPTLNYQRR